MVSGLLAGMFWGLDTVVLGIVLVMTPFAVNAEMVLLAPFISTFLHDFLSSIWMMIYLSMRSELKNVLHSVQTRSGRFIVLGALMGGPIGMSGYVAAIHYIGPSYTATISAFFPALGVGLARIFLKEKMSVWQFLGLLISMAATAWLGYASEGNAGNDFFIGFLCALICCMGWALEAVICTYGMRDGEISDVHAIQIRQATSSIFYGIIILPLLHAWGVTLDIVITTALFPLLVAAFLGTASYLCYYKALVGIGASRSMALNITYSAWAILFSVIFLQNFPSTKEILCSILIVGGSNIAGRKKENHIGVVDTTEI